MTRIYDIDYVRTHRGLIEAPSIDTIRTDMGESWQPPPPARDDPWRPRTSLDG